MNSRINLRRKKTGHAGYMLLFILFLLALLTVAIVASAPAVARQIQRDRELELIHRGQQYARAIRLFYRKFGRYPNSIKELTDTNHLRFLRREYKDPMTANGKWHLLHVGEASYVPMGFFGKKLFPEGTQQSSAFGSSSIFSPAGNAAANNSGGADQNGQKSQQPGAQQSSSPNGSSIFSSDNQTFGGGPIVGVASTSEKEALIVYNGKKHYNDWQFIYDPRMEQQLTPVVTTAPATNQPTNGFGFTPPQPQAPGGGMTMPH